jgi:signal transduction histidine kinase
MEGSTGGGPEAVRQHADSAHGTGLHSIINELGREFCRPLSALKDGLVARSDATRSDAITQARIWKLVSLCDDLLDLTRNYVDYIELTHGSRPLQVTQTTIAALVADIDRVFGQVAQARGLSWSCSVDGPDATISTDCSRCRAVLAHLIDNAIKYNREDGSIHVTAGRGRRGWWLTVADTGPGIPNEFQTAAFDVFTRFNQQQQGALMGSGLGLPASRALVGQLHGTIALDPRAREGTRVIVRLPLKLSAGPTRGQRIVRSTTSPREILRSVGLEDRASGAASRSVRESGPQS